MERVGWGRGTKTRPKTYSTILSYERTPTDTHNPLSYTELATEGQGARGEGGAMRCKSVQEVAGQIYEMTRTETNEVEKKNDELQEVRRHPPKIPAKSPLMALHTKPRFRNPP